MNANEGNQNKNLMIALVLSAVVLFGWNYFFPQPVPMEKTKAKNNTVVEVNSAGNEKIKFDEVSSDDKEVEKSASEVTLKSEKASVTIDSRLNLKSFSFANTNRNLDEVYPDLFVGLQLIVDGKKFNGDVQLTSESENKVLVNGDQFSGDLSLNDQGQLLLKVASEGKIQFIGKISSKEESKDQQINNFVYYTNELETNAVNEDDFEVKDAKIRWYGIDFDHHIFAVVVPGSIYHVKGGKETFNIANMEGSNELDLKFSFLKKNYDDLASMGDGLKNSVDFGIWSVIALPMLRGLQMFYGLLHNWGLAIIVLTILIRTVMFPLQHSSFKSMKKMQVLQPELKKIKEKYKDDMQKQQQETMALFKKHGANPMGGCLPLFLQMPIFFAFYRMLYNSVELVDAPFFFWINDLSARDPFYVLPVLVGLAMFFNMKLTPQTTMDPAQQKVMKFMPILFSAFLFTLPSGLNLYILVSTIIGMLQQMFVYKRTT